MKKSTHRCQGRPRRQTDRNLGTMVRGIVMVLIVIVNVNHVSQNWVVLFNPCRVVYVSLRSRSPVLLTVMDVVLVYDSPSKDPNLRNVLFNSVPQLWCPSPIRLLDRNVLSTFIPRVFIHTLSRRLENFKPPSGCITHVS